MALTLRYRKERERDCAWIGDPALMDVPESAKADWAKEGAAAHLQPHAKNGDLTIIRVRDLEADEARYVRRFIGGGQILLDNLLHSFFRLQDIALLIFDECHRAKGNYPYACILKVPKVTTAHLATCTFATFVIPVQGLSFHIFPVD
jgi:hypothetical protein